eukprot:4259129-Amphidinium_carterae.1
MKEISSTTRAAKELDTQTRVIMHFPFKALSNAYHTQARQQTTEETTANLRARSLPPLAFWI